MLRPAFLSTLLAAAAGAVFLLALGAFSFGILDVSALRAQADDTKSRATQDSRSAYELQQQASLITHTAPARASLANLAIPAGGDVNFISSLEGLAGAEHVTLGISSVSASGPSTSGAPGALTLTVQIQCSYAACVRFLQLVETSSVAVAVPSFTLTYDGTVNKWSGSFTMTALSFDAP